MFSSIGSRIKITKKDLGINMTSTHKKKRVEELPTLDQVFLVEDVLQNIDGSLIPVSLLKKKLSRKMKENTLMTILDYLNSMNKIAISPKGITWIHTTNPRLRKAIQDGYGI